MHLRDGVSLGFAALILLVIIPLAALALVRANGGDLDQPTEDAEITVSEETLAGVLTVQFETSRFVPCNPRSWTSAWLQSDQTSFYAQFEALARAAGVADYLQRSFSVFVRAEGQLELSDSPYQRFGHMSGYPAQFTVTKLLEMSPDARCP
ncbi:hypothetical protein AYO38_03975 [bacterium SCGC AG-212-C10]|nr:hypothetical protein AYO38_03975 [bacterium SCGC AG-212-C10]